MNVVVVVVLGSWYEDNSHSCCTWTRKFKLPLLSLALLPKLGNRKAPLFCPSPFPVPSSMQPRKYTDSTALDFRIPPNITYVISAAIYYIYAFFLRGRGCFALWLNTMQLLHTKHTFSFPMRQGFSRIRSTEQQELIILLQLPASRRTIICQSSY